MGTYRARTKSSFPQSIMAYPSLEKGEAFLNWVVAMATTTVLLVWLRSPPPLQATGWEIEELVTAYLAVCSSKTSLSKNLLGSLGVTVHVL